MEEGIVLAAGFEAALPPNNPTNSHTGSAFITSTIPLSPYSYIPVVSQTAIMRGSLRETFSLDNLRLVLRGTHIGHWFHKKAAALTLSNLNGQVRDYRPG